MSLKITDTRLAIHADPELLTNAELIERCRQLGSISLKARRMFMGLLPLVARREAYDTRKFASVHHFALIIGGVAYGLVDEILRLDRQLEEFPLLRRELYQGEIGWAKIRAVISLVKIDDQEQWIELLHALSKPALEVYLRDFRSQKHEENNLFSNPIEENRIIETSCKAQENSAKSPLLPKSVIFEAESFPGEICESRNGNKIDQGHISEKNEPINEAIATEKFSIKKQELFSKREKFSCTINQWLAAQLRLYRQKLEKEDKKWITWEDVLTELLKQTKK